MDNELRSTISQAREIAELQLMKLTTHEDHYLWQSRYFFVRVMGANHFRLGVPKVEQRMCFYHPPTIFDFEDFPPHTRCPKLTGWRTYDCRSAEELRYLISAFGNFESHKALVQGAIDHGEEYHAKAVLRFEFHEPERVPYAVPVNKHGHPDAPAIDVERAHKIIRIFEDGRSDTYKDRGTM